MIRFCACTKISQSSLENPRSRHSSKLCKLCGGRIPVDGPGAQSVSMLSTVGLELLPSAIDPQLTWNWTTASNGRQRAVRRARSSFTAVNRMKPPIRSSRKSEDLNDSGAKSTRDMPVSESEKLGVSILGRRFSESIENVPIKKRRFPLVPSPSPSHHSSSYSDASLYQGNVVNWNHFPGMKLSYGGSKADGKNGLEELSEKCCDAADFSGISILAAAACDGNVGGDYPISITSVSKGHSSGGQDIALKSSKLQFLAGGKEEQLAHTSEDSIGRAEVSNSSVLAAKESNDVKSDGSCNFGMLPSNLLHNIPNKTMEPVFGDVKFPWDLNTVMDVGESHDDEALNSEPYGTNVGVEAGQNANYEDVRTCEGQVGFKATKISSKVGGSKVNLLIEEKGTHGFEKIKMGEPPAISGNYSMAGYTESKPCFSIAHVDAPASDGHQLEVSINMINVSEEVYTSHVANKRCAVSGDFLLSVGGSLVSLGDSSLSSALLEEKKAEEHCKSFSSEVEIEKESYLVSCGNSIEQNTGAFEQHRGSDGGIIEATSAEDKIVASVAKQGNHSDYCMNDVQMALVTEARSLPGEKKEPSCTDLGTIGSGLHSLGNHLAERTPDVLVDGNICDNVGTEDASCGGNVNSGALNETDSGDADKMKEGETILSDADKMKEGETILSDAECEETDTEGKVDVKAAYMKVDTTETEMEVNTTYAEMKIDTAWVKINGVSCNELTDENLNDNKHEFSDHVGNKVLQSKSTGTSLGTINSKDGASGSHRSLRNHADGHAKYPQQSGLEDHLDCNYNSDAFLSVADQANGTKVEFFGDDDSQYEDGEFRQPTSDCWLEDGVEDGEVERVDYGSDRETDIYEFTAKFSNSINLQVNSGSLVDASVRTVYRAHVGKDEQHPVSSAIMNGPLVADSVGSAVGKNNVGCVAEEDLRENPRTEDCSKQLVMDVKHEGDMGLSHLTGSRMKMSGWDQLPGDSRSSSNGPMNPRVASINQNHTGTSLDGSISSESVRRVVGASTGRDLSSRMERAQSSEGSHRKDKSYMRTSRSNQNFNSQVEGDACASRSIGRNGPSLHLQGGNRGERFHGNSRHDSSGYYGPTSFPYPGSRNAAAAAVAKVESNGFVVAPDGTIVKASATGASGHLARGSGKASSQSNSQSPMGRGLLIERDRLYGMPPGHDRFRGMDPATPIPVGRARAGRYGPGMVRRERCRAPISDDVDSPHPGTWHDHGFSSRRRPFHLSRSRSRSSSRSRTRSPPRWTSPRGRNDGRMNNGPSGLQRNSKSPNFSSESTMARPRPIFREHMAGYAPLSRNHTSPPHSSRWIDRSKDPPEHFRGHEYGRFSPRDFSRGQKYDPIDSSKRSKPSEFYQPVNPGKFAEFVCFDGGTRHDRRGVDSRARGDRYEMHHSARQFDDKMKRFHYSDEDGFRSHNLQPKSSDFPGGESPGSFDRNVERQLEDSPWRFKEESAQCEKNGGGKNKSFTSFRVCEGDDNLDACRRRPS